eukprot:10260636-Alexandrium_andersonii.AAC.1
MPQGHPFWRFCQDDPSGTDDSGASTLKRIALSSALAGSGEPLSRGSLQRLSRECRPRLSRGSP